MQAFDHFADLTKAYDEKYILLIQCAKQWTRGMAIKSVELFM